MGFIRPFPTSSSLCEGSSSLINVTQETMFRTRSNWKNPVHWDYEEGSPNISINTKHSIQRKAPSPKKARVRKHRSMNKFSNYFRITSPVIQFNACVAQSPTTDPSQSLIYSTWSPIGLNDVIHTSPTTNTTHKLALIAINLEKYGVPLICNMAYNWLVSYTYCDQYTSLNYALKLRNWLEGVISYSIKISTTVYRYCLKS